MPHLHTLFSNALDPKSLHTVLLMTVTGAVVISSSSVQSDQVQRTVITLAAVAVETWQTMKEPLNEPGSSSSHGAVSNEVQGGWATVEVSYPSSTSFRVPSSYIIYSIDWECICVSRRQTLKTTIGSADNIVVGTGYNVPPSCQRTRRSWVGFARRKGENAGLIMSRG